MTEDPTFRSNFAEGINKFQSARMGAFWEEVVALMRGKPAELMSFEDIRSRLRLNEESYKGLQNIDVEKIVGSVGRYRDFTSSFLPKSSKMQERWSRIYAQANGMAGLPPIEVYQVGDVYFVRDGNHRVSVARQIDAKTIEAHVTELRTPIALRPNMSSGELDAATAYVQFLSETNLRTTRPHHQSLELSEPSRYGELMQHIYIHQHMLEQLEDRQSIPLRDAAAHWYDNVYRPAVTLIRKHGVLDAIEAKSGQAPRTEADLYLWMIEHLHEVRDECGDDAANTYSDALVDFMSEQRVSIPKELLIERDDRAPITQQQVMRTLNRHNAPAGFSGENTHVRSA